MDPLAPRPATGEGRRFERHAFVCVNEESCARAGPAVAIQAALKQKLKASGLKETFRINKSGCLGQCGHGPMMVVYPEGVWYCHLTLEDAERVWTEHILGGRPVDELAYRTREGGTNVIPKAPDGTLDRTSPWFSACTRCPP